MLIIFTTLIERIVNKPQNISVPFADFSSCAANILLIIFYIPS